MKKQRKRTCAKMLCICLMLSLVPAPVSAAETGEAVGSHEHTLECYTWAEACTHEHTLECYSQEIISENEDTHPRRMSLLSAAIYAAWKAAVSQKS